ncbi:MAG: hypothetical protein JWO30_3275 [Fibrobacteres bacterium]|nr:hypothetical protein [Fibrobacterota bacterium]
MLAFSRIPGNAFSFWIRKSLRWSRGMPSLPHEPKERLFSYLAAGEEAACEARERELRGRYRLGPLADASTRALYRKNLYLLDILEKACEGLSIPTRENGHIAAMDVGSQDWHYVFALERWLRHANPTEAERVGAEAMRVSLKGVEVDGYGIYPDFRSRKDYAQAYMAQTENPDVAYEIGDFLKAGGGGYGLITLFYPFVTRHHLLLWGLPLRFFQPANLLAKAAALTRPGGWLLVFTHTLKEHALFLELAKGAGGYELVREGRALSPLVDFHEDVEDRRFSIWRAFIS